MNCSADELGLGGDHDGLLILPADAPVGVAFAEYRGLSDTHPRARDHPQPPRLPLGRRRRARGGRGPRARAPPMPGSSPAESGAPVADVGQRRHRGPELCPRYTARLIRNVKIGPSPDVARRASHRLGRPADLQHRRHHQLRDVRTRPAAARLRRRPARARSGRPDRDRRAQCPRGRASRHPRRPRPRARRRHAADHRPVRAPSALAGVMGGESTEVHDGTVNVLLESACFSTRVDQPHQPPPRALLRGVDRASRRASTAPAALARSTAPPTLMAELAGGEVAPGIVDAYPLPADAVVARAPRQPTQRGLGARASLPRRPRAILSRLGCAWSPATPSVLRVDGADVPRRPRARDRPDRGGPARLGHGAREPTLPAGRGRIGELTREQRWRERVGETLRASGLNETMTYSFTDPADISRTGPRASKRASCSVELLNPMSAEQSVMRRSLLPGLLRAVSYNQNRGVADVHLYESRVGVPHRRGPQAAQGARDGRRRAGRIMAPAGLERACRATRLLRRQGRAGDARCGTRCRAVQVRAADLPQLQPGRSAEVLLGGEVVGWLGEVHPLRPRGDSRPRAP